MSVSVVPSLHIGFPHEAQTRDPRVILIPELATTLCADGFELRSEPGIGAGIGISDDVYATAGVQFVGPDEVWRCPLLLKYKAFRPPELGRVGPDQTIGGVFHAEGNPHLIKALIRCGARAYSYEFLREDGQFPLMRAGGHIAGVQAALLAARHLQTPSGGRGVLLGNVPGAEPVRVLVIGTGNVGTAAAATASALGAEITMLARTERGREEFVRRCAHPARVRVNTPTVLREQLADSDVVIGAILVSTHSTPSMIDESDLRLMRPGSVIVDATCGYGPGYLPTAGPVQQPSDEPRVVAGVLHVKIDVLPSLVPVTASHAYATHAAPYLLRLARAVRDGTRDRVLETALIAEAGRIIHPVVREHAELYGDQPT